jgi:hypothetical protein
MPRVEVTFFREEDGTVPLLEWLDAMSAKPRDKRYAALERLEEHGHELAAPWQITSGTTSTSFACGLGV